MEPDTTKAEIMFRKLLETQPNMLSALVINDKSGEALAAFIQGFIRAYSDAPPPSPDATSSQR